MEHSQCRSRALHIRPSAPCNLRPGSRRSGRRSLRVRVGSAARSRKLARDSLCRLLGSWDQLYQQPVCERGASNGSVLLRFPKQKRDKPGRCRSIVPIEPLIDSLDRKAVCHRCTGIVRHVVLETLCDFWTVLGYKPRLAALVLLERMQLANVEPSAGAECCVRLGKNESEIFNVLEDQAAGY